MRHRFCYLLIVLFVLGAGIGVRGQAIGPMDKAEIEKWRSDLRYLAEELPRRHKNLFHTTTVNSFENAIKTLDARILSLTRDQVIVEMARIVAMAHDGHTRLNILNADTGFRQYPLKLYQFSDGLFVQAAAPDYAAIVGARVVKIGNHSSAEAFKAVSEIVSVDNQINLKHSVPLRLVVPEILHALGLIEDMDRGQFTVEKDGRKSVIELKPVALNADIKWVDARDNATSTALWLQDQSNKFWFQYLSDSHTVYVQFNEVSDKPEETVANFFKRVFEFIEANPVERLVLDIRLNGGGNNFLNLSLIHGVIRCEKINQEGKLFTIIGRRTFSAAMMLAVDLEKHTRTIFVGEPTGSRPNVYGESSRFTLPNSRLTVGYSSLWWQYSDPRDTRKWIAPSIAATLSSADYRNNIDPALKAVLSYSPKPRLSETMLTAIKANDRDLAIRRYDEFRKDPQNEYVDTELELSRVGNRLLALKNIDGAIEILALNARDNPESSNVFSDLGEAYARKGNKELAIKNYEKSIELNPRNWDVKDKLKALRAK